MKETRQVPGVVIPRGGPLRRAFSGAQGAGGLGVQDRRCDAVFFREPAAVTGNRAEELASRGLTLIMLLCATLFFAGCSQAPAYDLMGSLFPAWLVCIVMGIVLAVAARWLLLRFHLAIVFPVLVYPSLAACFTFALWLIFFS